MKMRLYGSRISSLMATPPSSQSGLITFALAPKMLRVACCRIRPMPQVDQQGIQWAAVEMADYRHFKQHAQQPHDHK